MIWVYKIFFLRIVLCTQNMVTYLYSISYWRSSISIVAQIHRWMCDHNCVTLLTTLQSVSSKYSFELICITFLFNRRNLYRHICNSSDANALNLYQKMKDYIYLYMIVQYRLRLAYNQYRSVLFTNYIEWITSKLARKKELFKKHKENQEN